MTCSGESAGGSAASGRIARAAMRQQASIAADGLLAGLATRLEPIELTETVVSITLGSAPHPSASHDGPVEPAIAAYAAHGRITRARDPRAADTVMWSDLWGSSPPGGAPGGHHYPELGLFHFDRGQHLAALATPQRATSAVRERHDVDALAAAIPREHSAWLHEMTTAFGRDFLTPSALVAARLVVVAGLKAFANRGNAMIEDALGAAARPASSEARAPSRGWRRRSPMRTTARGVRLRGAANG